MPRVLLALVELVLVVYCLLSLVTTPSQHVRHLPKVAWFFVVLLFPIIGPLAWLIWGRPPRPQGSTRASGNPGVPSEYDRPGRAKASNPDDDEAFLRQLRERAEEQRRRAEEEERRRRESGES